MRRMLICLMLSTSLVSISAPETDKIEIKLDGEVIAQFLTEIIADEDPYILDITSKRIKNRLDAIKIAIQLEMLKKMTELIDVLKENKEKK